MKTIKLGQRLKTDIPGEFVFAKIDHKSYGLAGITESFFGQDYFVDEYLDGFTKEQCKKMLDCCYEDSILIPQNITVEEYFNSVEFNDIPVGTKFKLDNRIYTKVKSASNGEELAMDVNFMVYGILSTETVIIEK